MRQRAASAKTTAYRLLASVKGSLRRASPALDPGQQPKHPRFRPLKIQERLNFQAGLLRLDVAGQVYGCAARGVWAVPAAVRLDDLLAAPPWSLRGGWIRLNWATDGLHINGWLAGAIKEGSAHG
ncbi:hypothetical protein [Ottowia sp.]|uniref:hypothetical protein n=1 Tax=Ottowia sp. TaxID=1898956 RepID=UPI0039648C68